MNRFSKMALKSEEILTDNEMRKRHNYWFRWFRDWVGSYFFQNTGKSFRKSFYIKIVKKAHKAKEWLNCQQSVKEAEYI